MELYTGAPFRGTALEKLICFLSDCGLKYDERVEYSICLMEDDNIAATGSLDGAVLKCVAVSSAFRSEGHAARIISELVKEAGRRGHFHLFLFTRPENQELFDDLGFYPIAKTDQVLLMENKKQGIKQFVASLNKPEAAAVPVIGAIIANCNPFTRGHLYLIETAARQCGLLYIFIVSENKSSFPAETRLELVRRGIAHLPNVCLCSTGPYLVSAATFPDYFLKDLPGAVSIQAINTSLDLAIFAECFARPLGIKQRYVGTEPFDPVTSVYNRQMKELLPSYGIEVIEIPRLEESGSAVSASRVRRMLAEGNLDAIRGLVPPATYEYLVKNGE
jgi:[citrate (pro-3S)-lyase] ligase